MTKFEDLGLNERVLAAITKLGFDEPTPIQTQAIPLALQGRDIMGLAQTGTGKTAAFGLPLVHHLLENRFKSEPRAARSLILAPTRELVKQIADNLKGYTQGTSLKVICVVGGQSINSQRRAMANGCDILVATPGRLIDLLERGSVELGTAKFLVLDEADQMLDLGFIHALRKIARLVSKTRQTMLFSATMPKQMAELSRSYLNNPERVQVASPGKTADKIEQCVHFVGRGDKLSLLKKLLSEHDGDHSIVFARTKHGAEKMKKTLVAEGFKADSVHGNKSQGQRERAIRDFKAGETRILVATDVAARGIDIPGVSHVYNFDLPDVAENYVHRIGRTARAGAEGQAIAFCSPDEANLFIAIEKVIGISIPVASGVMKIEAPLKRGGGGQNRGRGANGGGGGNGAKPARQKRRSYDPSSGGTGDGKKHGGSRDGKPSGNRSGKGKPQGRGRARTRVA